jgi:hypothetical protein
LLALLDRLKGDLKQRVALAIQRAEQGGGKGKGREKERIDRAKVESLVEKVRFVPLELADRLQLLLTSCYVRAQKFFEHVYQTILKNCSVAGEPYKVSKTTRKVILKGGEPCFPSCRHGEFSTARY